MVGPEANRMRRQRLLAIAVLGGVCVRCGFSDTRALQIDHIDGNGYGQHGGMHGKGRPRAVYRRIANGDTHGFQLLCANCNWIKRFENNEGGHRPCTVREACIRLHRGETTLAEEMQRGKRD